MTLLFSLLLLCSLFNPAPALADIQILIYHRFGEDLYPSTNVAIESFREQMAYLRDNNYEVLPLATVVTSLKNHQPLPDRAVVITIDDGYESAYTQAWPILKSFGYPFTIFLNVRAVSDNYVNLLNWQQIIEMKNSGADIQDHGYAHHRLADWPPGTNEASYRKWIRDDLQKGKAILTERLGTEPEFLAIPYGEYNRVVIEEATSCGYKAILTQDPGSVSNDTNRFQIPREPILGYEWGTMDHFKMILARRDLPFSNIKPSLAPLTTNKPFHISAQITYPDRYESDSLDIYVSELGWLPATLEGNKVSTKQPVRLQKRLNRVAIEGKERASGRTAMRFWMLLRP